MTTLSGPNLSSVDLDVRRKKILFRAWHRGMKEMDLVLGSFADAKLKDLDENELELLERLMDVPDRELFKWISGEAEIPQNHHSTVLDQIIAFHGSK